MTSSEDRPGLLPDLGKMDIYLIDQIQKGRITAHSILLDAGFGKGRNLKFFVKKNQPLFGIDRNPDYVEWVREEVAHWNPAYDPNHLIQGTIENLPYPSETFDFVFCIAVLHFATSDDHFKSQLNQLVRVLKPDGFLMFRMTSWHTFTTSDKSESNLATISDGERYMLDRNLFEAWVSENKLKWVEPFKTVNVDNERTMSTVVLQK